MTTAGPAWAIGSTRTIGTEAMPRGLRDFVPAKMTSSMRAPRRVRADCSPSTQLIASLRFDLPQPLGPTTAAIPSPLKRNSVRSQNDLKPWSSTFLNFSTAVPLVMTLGGERSHTSGVCDKSKVLKAPDNVVAAERLPFVVC